MAGNDSRMHRLSEVFENQLFRDKVRPDRHNRIYDH